MHPQARRSDSARAADLSARVLPRPHRRDGHRDALTLLRCRSP